MESVIHPLVFLNISNHFTHASMNKQLRADTLLAGCLMGTKIGRRTELFTSFEIKIEDGRVNAPLLLQRASQLSECYSDYTVLGWYYLGSGPTAEALQIHKQISEITECTLLCLIFDEKQTQEEKQFTLYELNV